jgi:hypothetical protein
MGIHHLVRHGEELRGKGIGQNQCVSIMAKSPSPPRPQPFRAIIALQLASAILSPFLNWFFFDKKVSSSGVRGQFQQKSPHKAGFGVSAERADQRCTSRRTEPVNS